MNFPHLQFLSGARPPHSSPGPSPRMLAVCSAVLLLCANHATRSQVLTPPKREVRAVWVTTASGLDWPRSLDRSEQQSSLREIVANLQRAHFNTILFQVRARGDAYYHSTFEPWAENLTGTLGKDPGWDPLAFLLREAHQRGIEVHAWFNVFKIRGPLPVASSVPVHPAQRFAPWVYDVEGEGWLDPGVPEVRDHLLRVALEVVRNYPVDGINFDFLRYPGREFPDGGTYRRYGGGVARDDWRRANIDTFVSTFFDSAMRIRPMLKVGSSPLGVFGAGSGNREWGAFAWYYQDSRGWARRGKQDYLSPQLYWALGATKDNPDFASLAREWKHSVPGRQVWTGIGAYKPEVLNELPLEIDSSRSAGADGQSFFRYEHVRGMTMFGGRYATLADIPAMPWKDAVPPAAPTALLASEKVPDVIHLEWNPPPPAPDGDLARCYNIYRSSGEGVDVNDPRFLLAITTDDTLSFDDTIGTGGGYKFAYRVSALDKGNNESPATPLVRVTLGALLSLQGKLSEFTSLSVSVPHGEAVPLAAYRIAARTPILLQLVTPDGDTADARVLTLSRGVQDAGTYVVGIPMGQLAPGPHVLRLVAGETIIEHPLELTR